MLRRQVPPPTAAARMLKEYLDIINSKQTECGRAKWYDIYRRAGSGEHTNRMIKRLKDWGLVEGSKREGYRKTRKGEEMHSLLSRHADLVGILTQRLKGKRIIPW